MKSKTIELFLLCMLAKHGNPRLVKMLQFGKDVLVVSNSFALHFSQKIL